MCGVEIGLGGARGRAPKFCSSPCRQRAYRARSRSVIPDSVKRLDRWVRADGKRPVMVDGSPASSTSPETWAPFAAVQSGAGDGFGVMLGDGLGCYDLDHVSDDEARVFIATVRETVLFVERSVSGQGVHVFVEAPPAPGSRRVIDGVHVERYSRDRFIRVTGRGL